MLELVFAVVIVVGVPNVREPLPIPMMTELSGIPTPLIDCPKLRFAAVPLVKVIELLEDVVTAPRRVDVFPSVNAITPPLALQKVARTDEAPLSTIRELTVRVL
jgi:hypothetical protein